MDNLIWGDQASPSEAARRQEILSAPNVSSPSESERRRAGGWQTDHPSSPSGSVPTDLSPETSVLRRWPTDPFSPSGWSERRRIELDEREEFFRSGLRRAHSPSESLYSWEEQQEEDGQLHRPQPKKLFYTGKSPARRDGGDDDEIVVKGESPTTSIKRRWEHCSVKPCVVCWDNAAKNLIIGCGHLVYCNTCAEQIRDRYKRREPNDNSGKACPICRRISYGIQFVHGLCEKKKRVLKQRKSI